MNAKEIQYQIGLFLFQLNNTSDESGFKSDEKWDLKLTNEIDMKKIVKDYKPAIATQIPKGIIVEVYQSIRTKMKQAEDMEIALLDKKSIERLELNYIVAYNANRPIR
ncbi:hypothetical protein FA048_07075 [Pedobacter polaris]|uniref:Uncharacterized protein n=1 Tax=Pedobacter polaris TaxID=2571273 RepID=A0A4U1CR77_9SPHI|nr:hypothetical protein [Pedobacter polaris]TKC09966.1 hypothetical protein FA048_07075 [Pedobacter polaris]